MTIPNRYQISAEPSIVSYSFNDIAQGVSYVTFYGLASSVSGTIDYHLVTSNTLKSYPTGQQATVSSDTDVKEFDLDFDSSVLFLPMTMQGEAIVNVPIQNRPAGASNVTSYVIVYIRKWDGTTETTIVQAQSSEVTSTTTEEYTACVKLTVPRTHFKPGDYIRVTIEYYARKSGSDGDMDIAHDPANRDDTQVTDNTVIEINLPFKPDI